MQRRDFFKITLPSIFLTSTNLFADDKREDILDYLIRIFATDDNKKEIGKKVVERDKIIKEKIEIVVEKEKKKNINKITEENIIEETVLIDNSQTQLNKKMKIDANKSQDVYLNPEYVNSFVSVRKKLLNIQRYVGYGNFNIISFDEILNLTNNISSLEKFTKEDLEFMEYIFYYDPNMHGFYGKRISNSITDKIDKSKVVKIEGTGHYLFKGDPYNTYFKMLNDVGENLILTSGVRSVVKQMKLFLDKLANVDANLSVASKSLAPPAFSYHTIADFDVGKKGFGHANFSPRFALTEEFFKMRKLKYIEMRYTINNKDGVRYEPWHVKVI